MERQVVAEWLVDGFLHPPETLSHEFVDVDDFLRVPISGLADIVQFALVLVDAVSVLVFGEPGNRFRPILEDALSDRYPTARRVFLNSASRGLVNVWGGALSELDAFAVAVTQYRCAWDESPEILVQDDGHKFSVTVTYQDEKYVLSAHSS